jgi:hypothetical protein
VLIFKNGNRYIGDFVEGKLTGRGEMHWAFGDRYNGDFIGDKRTGRGEYLWKNGNRYVGDIVDSKLQGRGELRWADGSRYIGDFVLDKRQGFGVYIYPNEANRTATKARYSGNWVGGNPNGFGVYEYISRDGTNTSIYQGEFKDGQFHGFGQRDEKNSGGRPKYKTSIGKFEAGNYVGRPAVESGEYAVRDEYEDENRARAARNRSDNEEIYKQARDLFDNYLRLKRR